MKHLEFTVEIYPSEEARAELEHEFERAEEEKQIHDAQITVLHELASGELLPVPIWILMTMGADVAASVAAHQAASYLYSKLRTRAGKVKELRIAGQVVKIDHEALKTAFLTEIERLEREKHQTGKL
jgi:hypothetical protein